MNKYQYYKSIETLPIFNYYKLVIESDLRYLIKNIDFSELPNDVDINELKKIFYEFNLSVKDADLSLSGLYLECLKAYIIYLRDKSKVQKTHDTFAKYLKYLSSQNKSFTYKNEIYDDVFKLYDIIKNEFSYNEMIYERLQVFELEKIYNVKNEKFDLYNSILFISQTINITIDEFTCSVAKFNAFMDLAKKKYDNLKQKNGNV